VENETEGLKFNPSVPFYSNSRLQPLKYPSNSKLLQ
jgi:hypothetical protein